MDWIFYAGIAVLGGFGGAVVSYTMGNFALAGRIARVEQDFERLRGSVWGRKSTELQKEGEEELMAAVSEVMVEITGGAKPEDALKAVGARHPAVVAKLLKTYVLK